MGDELPTEPTTNTTSAKPKASDCCIADATIPVSVGKEEDEPCVGSDDKKYIGEHSSSACQADVGQRSCLDELPARRSPSVDLGALRASTPFAAPLPAGLSRSGSALSMNAACLYSTPMLSSRIFRVSSK